MLPTLSPGMFSNTPHGSGSASLPTTHVLHIGTDSGDYGENQGITTTIWGSTFGSITDTTVPSGTLDEFILSAMATTGGTNFYVVIEGVQTRDFFTRLSVQGMFDGIVNSADSTAYFVTDADGGDYYTFWRWDDTGLGNFASLGDRNVGFEYNPIYQTDATTKTYNFGPNSLYAWNSWPDPDTGDLDQYQGQFAQGGKMDVFAGFSSSLYPSSGSFGDPAIFGRHNGIAIGKITSSGEEWILLYLQNSNGSENYRITSTCWSGDLDTVDATYHSTENDVNWGTKAYGWLVTTLGWGGTGFDQFTITNLD